ncbi:MULTISPECIES: hypothetical protein [Natrinema]|uniref:Ser-Asp rich fibrinogen-binding, bone sialoprotein-binding protein n=1 Tax=Natrinema gari JCM 14663 TaxID=1230459 RepID=L9ZBB0_9EURY|nr:MULTISPECIES: hypothetical protein [Natrinema]AFO56046.1 Ser-Asp rich fibrinogen-binding, bone sialoprotein-binding protein [Natrinema sp. J7-2]ELY83770.1 Ser-Asp rich fibrinogen-binding, bone sialoprotein-binding protein [Natrinema gari JCM 14663]
MGAIVGLSGCLEALEEHYQGSFQGLVPIEIHSEAERHYDITLEAYKPGTKQRTYDESYTITANQSASPPHLDAVEQTLRVVKYGRDGEELAFREVTITPNTTFVNVRITDDDLILDVQRSEEADGPGPTAEPEPHETVTNGSESAGPAMNESEPSDGESGTGDAPATEREPPSDGDSTD